MPTQPLTRAITQSLTRKPTDPGLGGGVFAPSLIAPFDQTIFTVSVANTITASRDATITADGVGIGSATPSLSWTPGAVDNDVTLIATADSLPSDPLKVAVAAADNQSLWNFSTWSLTNLAVTSGQADPDGGTTAYKVIATTGGGSKTYRMFKDATSPPGAANSSGEVWVSPIGTLLPGFRFYPLNAYAEIKPATKEALSQQSPPNYLASMAVVETRVVSGRTWYRLWYRGENNATLSTLFVDFLGDLGVPSVDVPSGEHGFYVWHPRYVSEALPFYDRQRLMVRATSAASGVQRWIYTGPYTDTTADFYVKVLVPDTYDSGRATPYKVCVVAPIEPTPGAGKADELQVIKTAGYHNTYDTIFVSYSSTTNAYPWGGIKNDGKYDHGRIIASLPAVIAEHYNATTDRKETYLLGYSKGGWAAYSAILRNPDVFGYAAAWDAPWSDTYATLVAYGADISFGNEATFLLYQPYTTLPARKASVNDKTRLVISAGSTFPTQTPTMKTLMDSEGVGYVEVTGLTGVTHNADAAWMGPLLTAMMAL